MSQKQTINSPKHISLKQSLVAQMSKPTISAVLDAFVIACMQSKYQEEKELVLFQKPLDFNKKWSVYFVETDKCTCTFDLILILVYVF